MVNNRCDKNGVHGQLTPQAPLNHSGVCPRVGVGQSPAVVVVLGVGVGQSTPHLFTSSLPWVGNAITYFLTLEMYTFLKNHYEPSSPEMVPISKIWGPGFIMT